MSQAASLDELSDAAGAPTGATGFSRPFELLDARPPIDVDETEYWRLLGYPPDHEPSERALELAAWARQWYAENGRPWVYLRETRLELTPEALRLDGQEFRSQQLHDHLREAGVKRAMLVAVSAGRSCEEYARRLWQESKPDEYFFLEMFGSAVVEHLMATMNGRICDLAERDGLAAIPHYSPGYTGWDVADQVPLFELIGRGLGQPLPEAFEVLASGMLRPKKSLIAVVGLVPQSLQARMTSRWIPCEACSLSPCAYRRRPYRHARSSAARRDETQNERAVSAAPAGAPPRPRYSVSERALEKWSRERVTIERHADGAVTARFRFDGTTCSNMGRPLAFDYTVELSPESTGHVIRRSDCAPAPDDEGHRFMCAYLNDATALMQAIATEKPLLGQPLDTVLRWSRVAAPSGCHCTVASRAHKWGLALEAIHYTLTHSSRARATDPSLSLPPP